MNPASRFDSRSLYVNGTWLEPQGLIEVTDLADGDTFASVAAANPEQIEAALEAAEKAKQPMRETTVVQRVDWLKAIADAIEARNTELAEVVVRESGKPISSARGEAADAAERFRRAVEEARSLSGKYIEGTTTGHEGMEAVVKPEPVGLVLCIAPFNYPLSTTALQVAPAIAAGNAVILKPSSKTPVSAVILAECIEEAGLPDGAFNLVPGRSATIGNLLAADSRVNSIAMTGSSEAGKRVASESGMVSLHMELGGNAPAIIFQDAHLHEAIEACTSGTFKYAGQRCSAISRILADVSIHDEVVNRIDTSIDGLVAGDLFDESTTLGPVIDKSQALWIQELVDDAIDRGAELVRGGSYKKKKAGVYYTEPTLLANVPVEARIVREEQFGPVASVTTFSTEGEAVEIANSGNLALDAAVFTNDLNRAFEVADRVDAGSIRINAAPSHGLGDIPFGGNKGSGIGREGIGYTINSFTRTKTIVL